MIANLQHSFANATSRPCPLILLAIFNIFKLKKISQYIWHQRTKEMKHFPKWLNPGLTRNVSCQICAFPQDPVCVIWCIYKAWYLPTLLGSLETFEGFVPMNLVFVHEWTMTEAAHQPVLKGDGGGPPCHPVTLSPCHPVSPSPLNNLQQPLKTHSSPPIQCKYTKIKPTLFIAALKLSTVLQTRAANTLCIM